jgi:hypothetical protein
MVEPEPAYKINECAAGIQRIAFILVNGDYRGLLLRNGSEIINLIESAELYAKAAVEFFTELGYGVNLMWHPDKEQMNAIFTYLKEMHSV